MTLILYTECFYKKKFAAKTMKDAFLKASKWVASNIIARVELKDVQVKYEKQEEQLPTICIYLYAGLDEGELRKRHCNICKEMHHSFFIDENTNCDWCTTKAYQRRTNEMIKEKKLYYKKIITGE